ncbi:MAG: hypothetical protein C4325_09910 [Blastocatellia bacterium]
MRLGQVLSRPVSANGNDFRRIHIFIKMKEAIKSLTYNAIDFLTRGRGIRRRICGFDVRFPVRYSRYYPADYEPELFQFLEHNCQPGATFLDCGAHIGFFSVVASQLVGEEGRVVSFEPMPSVRAVLVLMDTIALNKCRNVNVRPEALSSGIGKADFFDTGEVGSNANSLVQQERHHRKTCVSLTTLDAVRQEMKLKIDCAKIDVEGAEYDLLIGAAETISKDRPQFFLSLHPQAIHSSGASLDMIWDLLESYSLVVKKGEVKISRETFISQTDLFDVVCIPDSAKNVLR